MTSLSTTRCWLDLGRVHRGHEPGRVRLRVLPARRRLRDERRGVDERVHDPARAAVVAGGALVAALRGDGERQQHVGVRAGAEAGVEAVAVVPVAVDPGLHAVGERPVALLVQGGGGGGQPRRARRRRGRWGARFGACPEPPRDRLPRPSATGWERSHQRWRSLPPKGHAPRTSRSTRRSRIGPQRAREDRRHVVLVLVDERTADDRVAAAGVADEAGEVGEPHAIRAVAAGGRGEGIGDQRARPRQRARAPPPGGGPRSPAARSRPSRAAPSARSRRTITLRTEDGSARNARRKPSTAVSHSPRRRAPRRRRASAASASRTGQTR